MGELSLSQIYKNRYLLRIADGKSSAIRRRPVVYTWPLFKTNVNLPSGSRVGIYSAGGATRAFLEKIDLREYCWDCIIDKYRRGSLHRIPVVSLDEAVRRDLDCIFVTSVYYYPETRVALLEKGLKERDDFCLICFSHQDNPFKFVHQVWEKLSPRGIFMLSADLHNFSDKAHIEDHFIYEPFL